MRLIVSRSASLLLALVCGASLAGRQQPPPAFRSEIDSVQIDLRVVDGDGRFVGDLALDDLQVYEDGQPQTITTFGLVEIPIDANTAAARRDGVGVGRSFQGRLSSDVVSNLSSAPGRLYVMVLDNLNTHPFRAVTVRDLAKRFVDQNVTDVDHLAIVTTSGARDVSQEFTSNRQRLHSTIDRFTSQSLPAADVYDFKQTFLDALSTLRSLKALAAWLGAQSGGRKSVVFISEGLKFDVTDENLNPDGVMNPDAMAMVEEMRDLVTAATRANVSIYPIDARGLPTSPAAAIKPLPFLVGEDPFGRAWVQAGQSLHELADATGGVALVHSNDFDRAFDRIVEEASSYYLVGYTPSNPGRDGRFRRIEVRASRPGLTVRARSGYAANASRGARPAPAPGGMPRELVDALRSPLAVSGLTLSVFAAPFRGEGSRGAIGVVVQANGSDLQVAERQGRFHGSLEVAVAAADADGRIRDSERGTLTLRLRPQSREMVAEHGIRMLSRLDLPAGRYQLRVAAIDALGATRGSVQYDLDVPDFSKGPLSMSGIVLASPAAQSPLAGDLQFWEERSPEPPATLREFSRGAQVTAFAEIYTNDQRAGQQIDVETTVAGETGAVVFTYREGQAVDMTKGKSAAYRHRAIIPLTTIDPGRYVLTVRAETGAAPGRPVSRQIPFTVR
jgi:VWFA-related protein